MLCSIFIDKYQKSALLESGNLHALHRCIESCPIAFVKVSKTELRVVTRIEQKVLLHLLLAVHIADLPETEHKMSEKRSPQPFSQ